MMDPHLERAASVPANADFCICSIAAEMLFNHIFNLEKGVNRLQNHSIGHAERKTPVLWYHMETCWYMFQCPG